MHFFKLQINLKIIHLQLTKRYFSTSLVNQVHSYVPVFIHFVSLIDEIQLTRALPGGGFLTKYIIYLAFCSNF